MAKTEESYCLQLHHCEADNHFHLITGDESISWPFWSRDAGLKLVDFTLTDLFPQKNLVPKVMERLLKQASEVRSKIVAYSRIQLREDDGRFQKGFRMRREMHQYEGDVANSWARFRRGEVPYACYMVMSIAGTFLYPLYCDFAGREAEKPDGTFTRNEWIKLAEAPAKIVTMADLGITIKEAA